MNDGFPLKTKGFSLKFLGKNYSKFLDSIGEIMFLVGFKNNYFIFETAFILCILETCKYVCFIV